MRPPTAGRAFRVNQGDTLAIVVTSGIAATVGGTSRVVYDDGGFDLISFPPTSVSAGNQAIPGNLQVKKDGWIISYNAYVVGTQPPECSLFGQLVIASSGLTSNSEVYSVVASGYIGENNSAPVIGQQVSLGYDTTFVVQGTVAEDATVGTHVTTLTVSPQNGHSLQVIQGQITVGATATAQTASCFVTDGSGDTLGQILNANGTSGTTAGLVYSFPSTGNTAAIFNTGIQNLGGGLPYLSGGMSVVLQVSTAAVSVTQTFALVVRLRGPTLPSVAFADNTGTPTITTNVAKVI